MKTIGKIAVLAMTLSLAFVLTACGGSSSSSAASSASASASSASASASASSEAASSESAAASSESAAASSESASATSESAAASSESASESASASSSSSDSADADTYVNEFFGLQFDKPADWKFVSTEDINGPVSSLSANAHVDMLAASSDAASSVVVTTEADAKGTAEEQLKAEREQIESAMTGDYDMRTTDATITFEGYDMEIPASFSTINANGTTICIGIAVEEKDGNLLEIIAMGADEDSVEKSFKNFKAIGA